MESGEQVPRKGRKLGSSRRRQMREPADGQDALVAPEPESWSSQSAAELQGFFQDCGAKERGFVTREDLAVAKFSFLGSEEEPGMIFDWVDVERKGRLSLEEFSSGLQNIFGSSPSTHILHRRRPLPSKRRSAATSLPTLEEANPEEKEAFFAFMEQLGASHSLAEQAETWQLWRKLRQEEPQLAGNLEGFLAKMHSRLKEARADKEVLQLTLRKRDSDHHRKVQQLYEEMEQQIQREKQQLQAESDFRGLALSSQMQEVLEAKEREVQRLTEDQKKLEAQLHRLSSTHQEASSENQQLRETKRDLAGQLEEVRGQLQVTRGHLSTARDHVSWQMEEEPSVPRAGEEKPPDPQAVPSEEAPLPGLTGDNDDRDQLLSSSCSTPHRALRLSWSPPPIPRASARPQAPQGARQISISGPQALLFGPEPPSEPDGSPRSPPGVTSRTKEEKGVDAEGQDIRPEQTGEPPSLEPKEESGPGPGVHFHWGLPGAPAGESGSLVAAALKVSIPLEDGPPPQVTSPPPQAPAGPREQFQASYSDDEGPGAWRSGSHRGIGAGRADPEQTGEPPSLEPKEESGPGPGGPRPGPAPAKLPRQREALYQDPRATGPEPGLGSPGAGALTAGVGEPSQGLEPGGQAPTEGLERGEQSPDAQEGHPGGLQEAHSQVLGPEGPPALPHQSLEEEPRAEERKAVDPGGQDFMSEQTEETNGLSTGHSEFPQHDSLSAPLPTDRAQAQAEAEAPAPEKPSPSRGSSPTATQPGDEAGPQEPTQTLRSRAELEAQPRPRSTTTHAEEETGPPQPMEPRAETRPEDPGMDSGGTGLTPSPGDRTASEPLANPDYTFHVIFLGDSNVGKTSFLHLLHQNTFASGLTATVGVDFRVKNLLVDNKCFALQLWDTAGQERYHSVTRQLLHKADGVVLMYDVTSQESFAHVRYWLNCLQDTASDGVVVLLLGNKTDCEEDRQVSTEAGQQLAQELGVSFGECSAALGHNILEPVVNLARSLKMQEERLKRSLVEVAPEKPRKRAGCCS
ncbi:ras-related protein Rab-44 [Hippopotamus amphibius kiboko]|uniref:ras-related protein Rab-44 n=1 Tax=Hippopotamus amphibius kiboko TaxID=575201 RepID=UPI002598B5BA|nr:ras-related protein Rab-44 [Hippopotamus amphibius kiboko]